MTTGTLAFILINYFFVGHIFAIMNCELLSLASGHKNHKSHRKIMSVNYLAGLSGCLSVNLPFNDQLVS